METEYRSLAHRQADEILESYHKNKKVEEKIDISADRITLGTKLLAGVTFAVIGGVVGSRMPLDAFNPIIEFSHHYVRAGLNQLPHELVGFITPTLPRYNDLIKVPIRGGVTVIYSVICGLGSVASLSILEMGRDALTFRGKTKY